MKNKLKKTYRTPFDRMMRKLGGCSIVILAISFSFLLPLSLKIDKNNDVLTKHLTAFYREIQNEKMVKSQDMTKHLALENSLPYLSFFDK